MSSGSLFSSEEELEKITIDLQDAEVSYFPNFLDPAFASKVFKKLLEETEWQDDEITLFGKTYAQPRRTALYGLEGKSYSYSGITMEPNPFTPLLQQIKRKLDALVGVAFSTVLLNLYRDGTDSNGWHSDNEKELGENPIIASVSLGAKRSFHMKHKGDKNLKYKIFLDHGSLLLMQGPTQHFWLHQLPKSKRIFEPRINLTFRIIK